MTGTVELDPNGTHLLIRFQYREDLVAMVKELPGRRWDPRNKVWRVPAQHVEAVYAACSRHLFEFAAEVPSLLAGTLQLPAAAPPKERATGDPGSAEAVAAPETLSISQLNERVRDGLRERFRDAFWISGEVVDFDKSAGREHRFFQLVERARGLARPRAAVEVALFAATADRLLPALQQQDPPLTLRDGLEIRVLVRVDLYVATGRFQVVVQDIDPSFTLGKLALTREQIVRELIELGLADRNRSLGMPVPALRIGVLSSPDADGWNDFLRHLQESRCGFELTLFPIKVQGPELKPTLLRGLAWFAEHADAFDVLCIVRGGGSRSDLAWFDDRELAIAVARHPLKVVVGIGHQRDQSVLDMIAQSEKTPTAVAEFLVRGVEAVRGDVRQSGERLQAAVAGLLADARRSLSRTGRDIAQGSARRLAEARSWLRGAGRELAARTAARLTRETGELRHASARLRHGATRSCERAAAALLHADTRRRLLDPRRVLERGYVVVRTEDGRIAPSVERLAPASRVRVQFRDGHADAHVERVHRESP